MAYTRYNLQIREQLLSIGYAYIQIDKMALKEMERKDPVQAKHYEVIPLFNEPEDPGEETCIQLEGGVSEWLASQELPVQYWIDTSFVHS